MSLNPTCVLGLVLCLGHVIPTQEGVLPRPSIWAEPGSEIPRGQPVTIVCQGPAGAETLHLEKEGSALLGSVSDPVHKTQARFPIPVASKDTARRYRCLYNKDSTWSDRLKELQLVGSTVESPSPPLLEPGISAEVERLEPRAGVEVYWGEVPQKVKRMSV
ncbi:unnamed protein product [Nyctereutes procyonoides]|uniref:(raccoon dog) hypothetical protein n=1 Tax=Nyctereutes procyonoides TaxID=34880 RepID=A0A811ZTG9_NYCPR|nr:unnamed protein product [Nyctereutes procyonoides]